MKPKIIDIVAGPNGSGKTTFAESFFTRTRLDQVFLNPDLIASGLGPLNFEMASFQAGRILIQEVKSKIHLAQSFCFESTLSGKSWFPILKDACEHGYHVNIYFLYLTNVKNNLRRIEKRVKQGGHLVPADAVVRRYPRCFSNFWNLYRPICHNWHVFDNSNSVPKIVMSKPDYDHCDATAKEKFKNNFLVRGKS